jgi:hypothetical protein
VPTPEAAATQHSIRKLLQETILGERLGPSGWCKVEALKMLGVFLIGLLVTAGIFWLIWLANGGNDNNGKVPDDKIIPPYNDSAR